MSALPVLLSALFVAGLIAIMLLERWADVVSAMLSVAALVLGCLVVQVVAAPASYRDRAHVNLQKTAVVSNQMAEAMLPTFLGN